MKPLGLRAPQGNQMQPDVRAFWKTPRARVHNTPGNPSYGAGAGFVGWDTVDYDTDDLTTTNTTSLVARTRGVYWVAAHSEWQGGGGGLTNLWVRLIINGNAAAYATAETDVNDTTALGRWFDLSGLWHASVGDSISMYYYTSQPTVLAGGADQCWMCAHWVSSFF